MFDDVVHLEPALHLVTLGALVRGRDQHLCSQVLPAFGGVQAAGQAIRPGMLEGDGVDGAATAGDERAAARRRAILQRSEHE